MLEHYISMPIINLPFIGHVTPMGVLAVVGMYLMVWCQIENMKRTTIKNK